MLDPLILSIESSCDDTGAAVMQGRTLLSHRVASQVVHERYGGVVPELASRAHQEHILPTVERVLQEASVSIEDITAIGVTQGPGLLGSLLVGIAFANGLGMARKLPVIGIHHTRAHLLANFIDPPFPAFPFLGLVVSGGHTQLARVDSPLQMTLLGSTLDDAAGEAFDKIAKMLGFPYPGGVHIDKLASQGDPMRFAFPRTKTKGVDFSFSGLKTAVFYFLKKQQDPHFVKNNLHDLCASIQSTIVAILLHKIQKASREKNLKSIVVGGGVANNSLLRRELYAAAQRYGWEVFIPKPAYCTDNAGMVAIATYYHLEAGLAKSTFVAPMPRMLFSS